MWISKQEVKEVKERLRDIFKVIYQDHESEFTEIATVNDQGNNVSMFISSESGIMVNVYDKYDEDQENEIWGGHVDRYEEGYEPSEAEIEKQVEFALELAGISDK